MRNSLLQLTAALLLAAPVCAADFTEARQLYFKAVANEAQALQKSRDLFLQLRQDEPLNPVLTAYLGSLRLLESARTWALTRKGELAKQGLTLLDEAVTLAPENEEVRFLRAMSTYHLPGWFKRRAQCEADFAWLAERAVGAVEGHRLPADLAAAAMFHDGLIQLDNGNKTVAAERFREVVARWPDTPAGKDAAKRL